jgi:CheY-like chemotaxis protein
MLKVVVIEDETLILENLLETLTLLGYDATGAADGNAGINLVKTDQPDLIICDIMMPGVDGWQVYDSLRSDPGTASIPFIFLTAVADDGSIERAVELGVDGYVTKPFMTDDLVEVIHSVRAQRSG